jgi:hypothetical protein
MTRTALQRHPESRGDAVRSIQVEVRREQAGIRVLYRVEGRLDRLRVPQPRAPRFADGLWRHTCCEIFVARHGSPAYHEFNFSPSGEWAAYAFSGYREGMLRDENVKPTIRLQTSAGALELEAAIPCAAGKIAVGLSAVMEEQGGTNSYWALRHPPGKPDFHHRDAFALELA